MNTFFIRLAYRRTVVAHLRRTLMEKNLEGGGGQKEPIICEDVAFSIREVPQEMIAEMIMNLEAEEKRLTDEMAQYEFRKRDEQPPIVRPEKPEEQPAPAADDGGKPAPKPGRAGRKSRGEQQGAG